ncbi:MAG: arsenate reductase (glutaredoxin) [Flavipsychrobacter sp.]
MSDIIIYHNGRCSKSRGALEILQEKGVPFQVRWYLTEPLNQKEIKALLKKLGMKASELVRTGEPLYKEQFKDQQLTEQQWVKVLAENPVLIERPIVEKGDKAIVARPPEKVLAFL